MRLNRLLQLVLPLGFVAVLCSVTLAVPYASFVYETGTPDIWEFVLNDTADDVTILRDGGNALNLGALTKGRHTFDMTGFATFDIQVAKNESTNWRTISSDIVTPPSPNPNAFRRFFSPSDVIVQNDPTHPMFGAVYVNNAIPSVAAGANGRPTGDGIYALTTDLIGVDLTTRSALVDPADTSAAKAAANWQLGDQVVGGQNFLGTVSGWRMNFDDDGNIIMGDWSDSNGGIKYLNPDLTSGGLVLAFQDGVVITDDDGAAGPNPPVRVGLIPNGEGEEVHGSIVSRPHVTGSIGNGLTVTAIDEDFDLDGETVTPTGNTGNHIWKWNVGNVTDYDQPPELVVSASAIPAVSDGRANFLNLNVGVLANAVYSAQHDKWYMSQNRADGNQGGLVVVTPDNVDGTTPTLEWSSLQFTIDNGLDGHTTVANSPNGQDMFRSLGGGMVLSEDGTKLYVHRVNHSTVNPVTGTTSNLPGAVLIIPLDEDGIPDLTVSGGLITNMESITTISNAANASRRGLWIDAAGNVYTTNNSSELLEVFTPAGNFLAVTSYDGTQMSFDVSTVAAPSGDYNEDGLIDAADYVLWRKIPDAHGGDPGGYDAWRESFSETSPGAGGGDGSVPEPASLMLVVLGMLIVGGCHRR